MMRSEEKIQKRGENTEAAILEAAEKLFMEQGFASTTTMQIAKRAGIAPQVEDKRLDAPFAEGNRERVCHRSRSFPSGTFPSYGSCIYDAMP